MDSGVMVRTIRLEMMLCSCSYEKSFMTKEEKNRARRVVLSVDRGCF